MFKQSLDFVLPELLYLVKASFVETCKYHFLRERSNSFINCLIALKMDLPSQAGKLCPF